MLLADQQAGIGIALVIGIGLALLSRLLFKPKDQQVLKSKQPNSPSERGSFIPLVLGTRRVGAVVLYVGNRSTQQVVVGGDSKTGEQTQTAYFEKAIHALCVGPVTRILGIYCDGELVPGSTELSKETAPEGTPTTFAGIGTMRVYWGTLESFMPSLLQEVMATNTQGPYVCRVEWDKFRLGFNTRWPTIEYVVEAKCVGDDTIGADPLGSGVNPAQAFTQIVTGKFPHGGGLDPEWIDPTKVGELATLSSTELISFNIVVLDGDTLDSVVSGMMQDMGFFLVECNGVLAPYPIRKITDPVPLLDNDLLQPPIDEVERQHITKLGNALVYQYVDRDQGYRQGTIDIDDDSISFLRNQRKTKKVAIENVTERDVASIIASRRQVEDLSDPITVKAKGLRGLRAALPGHPFDLPGVGRVRLISHKLLWNEPTVQMEFMVDPFDQDPIEYTDPGLPGETVDDDLIEDIRFDTYEAPHVATSGTNTLVTMRHRGNKSMTVGNIWASNDGLTYTLEAVQNVACGGGVLDSDWDIPTVLSTVEEGPIIAIDPNGDEDLPLDLSSLPSSWVAGDQLMAIGSDPRNMEFFFVRDWIEVTPGVTWQPRGLVRARFGRGMLSPRLWQTGRYIDHFAGEPCYIIGRGDLTLHQGGTVATAGVQFSKAQPGNASGVVPLGAVQLDIVAMQSVGSTTPPLTHYVCGGSFTARTPTPNVGRRDMTWVSPFILSGGGEEDIIFEFLPAAKSNGAGLQGAGQPVAIAPITGFLRVEVYMDVEVVGETTFDDMTLRSTYNILMSTLLQPSGMYSWTYTRIQINTDGPFGPQPYSDQLEADGGTFFMWKFLLYHNDGTLSPPIELRPHCLEDNGVAEQYVPGIGTNNSPP